MLGRDNSATLFARREFEEEVYVFKRNAQVPGTPPASTPRAKAPFPPEMATLEDAAREAFADVPMTML